MQHIFRCNMIQSVITGDIVGSSKLDMEERKKVLSVLNDTLLRIKEIGVCNELSFEMFRGDSFQIVLNNPACSLSVAIIIRVALRANAPKNSKLKWDTRLSIGVGTINFASDKITTSDGEAFRNSGRGFDKLKKNERLVINTPWCDFNKELEVSTGFADTIITKWTQKQAEAILPELIANSPQKDIAQQLNKTVQNINLALNTAKLPLIKKYINRFQTKIEEYGNL